MNTILMDGVGVNPLSIGIGFIVLAVGAFIVLARLGWVIF